MADGWRLNLYPPGWDDIGWSDFPHREAVLEWFREQLGRGCLTWDVVEFTEGGNRTTTWVCPECRDCWLCFQALEGGPLEVVQASFPVEDSPWAARLAWAVMRAVCMYRLVIEA